VPRNEDGMTRSELVRGYGPLAVLTALFVLMIVTVPSKSPSLAALSAGPSASDITTDRWASGDDQVAYCSDASEPQVKSDSYSPPCFTFSGDNGGETSRGVTADTIKVGYRQTAMSDLQSIVNFFAGKGEFPADQVQGTFEGLIEYFNSNFQFYGRKLELVPYKGTSDTLLEFTGKNAQAAQVDATKAADELEVFADITAGTQPFNDALARKKVIAIGAPYLSDEYFQARRPYAWSRFPSCTIVSKAASEITAKLLAGKPAEFAGGALKGQPRKIALVHPNNPEYTNCAKSGLEITKQAGADVTAIPYELDAAKIAEESTRVSALLREGGYTTVGCACDPVAAMNLLPKATALNYFPEWTIMGVALTDTDFTGQTFVAKGGGEQWARDPCATALGEPKPFKETDGYKAFKSVRPNEEPVDSVNDIYNQIYILALGVHMAGPDLTPENYEKGMFSYSERTGELGSWKFGPGKYTPQTTVSLVYWDSDAPSPTNGEPGTLKKESGPFHLGEIPEHELQVFK
jgi:hypothetical protein